jgi:RNA polymerase sigma factor (sigma-70 family)
MSLVATTELSPYAEDNLGIARFVANKFVGKQGRFHLEDTEEYADALVGLVKAEQTYKAEHGAFSTWACNICRNEIIRGINKRKKQPKEESIVEETVKAKDEVEPKKELDLEKLKQHIDLLIEKGDKKQKKDMLFFKKVYFEGQKVVDLANNCSRMAIYLRLDRAKKTLRDFVTTLQNEVE